MLLSQERMTFTTGNRQFLEKANVVDPAFFQVIKLPLVLGDPAQVIFGAPIQLSCQKPPFTNILEDTNPIGRTIKHTCLLQSGRCVLHPGKLTLHSR